MKFKHENQKNPKFKTNQKSQILLQCYLTKTELQILLSFYFKILDKTRYYHYNSLWFIIQLHPIYLLCVLLYDSKNHYDHHHMDMNIPNLWAW